MSESEWNALSTGALVCEPEQARLHAYRVHRSHPGNPRILELHSLHREQRVRHSNQPERFLMLNKAGAR